MPHALYGDIEADGFYGFPGAVVADAVDGADFGYGGVVAAGWGDCVGGDIIHSEDTGNWIVLSNCLDGGVYFVRYLFDQVCSAFALYLWGVLAGVELAAASYF